MFFTFDVIGFEIEITLCARMEIENSMKKFHEYCIRVKYKYLDLGEKISFKLKAELRNALKIIVKQPYVFVAKIREENTFWKIAFLWGEKFEFFGLIILLRVVIQVLGTKEVTFRNFV